MKESILSKSFLMAIVAFTLASCSNKLFVPCTLLKLMPILRCNIIDSSFVRQEIDHFNNYNDSLGIYDLYDASYIVINSQEGTCSFSNSFMYIMPKLYTGIEDLDNVYAYTCDSCGNEYCYPKYSVAHFDDIYFCLGHDCFPNDCFIQALDSCILPLPWQPICSFGYGQFRLMKR